MREEVEGGHTCTRFDMKLAKIHAYMSKTGSLHLAQPDSLELRGHLIMFQSTTLQGQADLAHKLLCYSLALSLSLTHPPTPTLCCFELFSLC